MPPRARLGALAATIAACVGGGIYAFSPVACACTTPSYAAPFNTIAPVVSGGLTVGSTLSATTGTWVGDTSSGFTYQWVDDNGNIGGATSATYVIGGGETGLNISVTVTATGTGGSASAGSNTVGPVTAGSTTAHVWVSTAGNNATCARNAALVDYATALAASPTNVCATGPVAYQKSQLGETVLMESSTFTTQWNFAQANTKSATTGTCDYNYGGVSDFSNCVTIKPATGQTVTFNVAGTNSAQIFICVNFLSIQNVSFTETDYVAAGVTLSNPAVQIGKGDATCIPSSNPPHDLYLSNNTYGGQLVMVGGANNTWVVGGLAASTKDWPWQGGGNTCLNLGPCLSHSSFVNHSGVIGVTFDGFNFANTDPSGHHMECDHIDSGADTVTYAGNRVLSCPVQSLFFETEGSTGSMTNVLVENNYFDSGANLVIDCHNKGCVDTGNTVRFNSFHATAFGPLNDCSGGTPGVDCIPSGNVAYGNTSMGCASSANAFGLGWTTAYNVQTGAQSGICAGDATSTYSATVTYASPGSPNYNLDLSGAQTATNFVPSSVTGGWPAANIYGVARSGGNTNAGAD